MQIIRKQIFHTLREEVIYRQPMRVLWGHGGHCYSHVPASFSVPVHSTAGLVFVDVVGFLKGHRR